MLSFILGKGTKQLEIESVSPTELCGSGNETIEVILNTDSEKAGK